MNNIRQTLIELYGEEEADAELKMALENIEYDMENMSFHAAIFRALDDLGLEYDYAESLTNELDSWIANKK